MNSIHDFFQENGFYHARGVFSPDEIRELELDFDRLVAQLQSGEEDANARWRGAEMERLDSGASEIIHTHNVQNFSARWHLALLHKGFLDIVEQLIGADIVLHHSKLFQKPPEKGSPFPMHQDWLYFPTEKDSMLAGVIHVSDATDEMGCLRVVPGSHKLGRVENTMGDAESDLLKQHPIESAQIVECAAGDVVFFCYFTLHGSMPNRSQRTRKTVLAQMHAGDDRLENNDAHTNARLVLRGWNHAISRSFAGL